MIHDLEDSFNKTYVLKNTEKKKNKDMFSKILKEESLEDLKRMLYFKNLQINFLEENNIDFEFKDDILKLNELQLKDLDKLTVDEKESLLDFVNKAETNSDIFSDELKVVLKCL
jgi:hypothetical protein